MLNCNQTNYCLMIGDSLLFPWADPDSLDTEISLYQKPTVSLHIGLSYCRILSRTFPCLSPNIGLRNSTLLSFREDRLCVCP